MKLNFWRSADQAAPVPAPIIDKEAPKRRTWLGRSLAGMFKAAQADETDKWTTTPETIDQFITIRHQALVARSREQWSNNPYVKKFVKLVRKNVVGPIGVTMQAKAEMVNGKQDKNANAAHEADWCDWGKKGNCDVTGTLSWREIQALVMESTPRDGEYIVRLVYGPNAGPHGFALQLIDPLRLPANFESRVSKDGNFIRHGIEFNSYGRPVAYHFTSMDESDANYYVINGRGYVRIDASEIIHDFVREFVGQKRGIPWAAVSLGLLRDMNGFQDAAVKNARAGASKMGFFEWEQGFGPEAEDDTPLTIDAEPLSFHELPEGARLKDWNPQYPSGEFAPFNKAMLRGAASGMDVPYNELASDLEGVNFSSIRQGTLDARESYKEMQQWLIESLISRVHAAWLKWRLLNGAIVGKNGKPLPADKLTTYKNVQWQARRWAWIDPKADVDADLAAIRGGIKSPIQVIREQGRDPETVAQEFATFIDMLKAENIDADLIKVFLTGQPPQQQPKPAEPKGKE